MTDTKIFFSPFPLPALGPTEEQAVWKSLNDPSMPNKGWIDWFGFMARCNIDTGKLEKVTSGPVAPDNVIFFDGSKLYSQPNFNFTTGKREDPNKPANVFFFAAGAL